MKKLLSLAGLSLALWGGGAQATIIFTDNFDSETLALNASLTKWTVSDGTVDLIGSPSFFDFLPGNGRYVDLDGSSGNAGRMSSIPLTLAGGVTYDLFFDLAGSQRGDTNTVTYGIDLDSNGILDFSANQTLASSVPFTLFTLTFTPSASTSTARIVFDHAGGDNVGLLLDDVRLESRPTGVPEPATWSLLGLGLAGLAWRRKAAA